MIALVAAIGRNNVIGNAGRLPWHLPADLAYFRGLTKGRTVVMGRKTADGLKRPLKGRTNVVLTRNPLYPRAGFQWAQSVDQVLAMHDHGDIGDLFIIGGAEIYHWFMGYADVLFITRIDHEFEGDTFFPVIGREWQVSGTPVQGPKDEKNPYDYWFTTYRRAGAE